MLYLDALKIVHEKLKPSSYVEIGCRFGASLALADCVAIGIDPNMRIEHELSEKVSLFDLTSDEFFENNDLNSLLGRSFDLAFVDGMHLAEFALTDFINLEKKASNDSVVLFDDILPKRTEYAGREPESNAWCGDVYKVIRILKKYRPDLEIAVFDIAVKGLGVVSNVDPSSTILSDNYAQITEQIAAELYTSKDVQELRKEYDVKDVSELSSYLESVRNKLSCAA